MRVNSIKNSPDFKGGLNNKTFLKSLEKISEHGASFAAGVSFVSAVALRPLAISLTPKTDKKNKQYASANSIASGIIKLAAAEAVILPVENAVKKIDKNPSKFLNKKTIETLKGGAKTLNKSGDYKFLTQGIKLSSGTISAIPKSILTIALIPVIMDKIFKNKTKNNGNLQSNFNYDKVFEPVYNKLSFKGGTDKLASGIGKIINNNKIQEFALKHSKNDSNIARNVTIATDVLLTAANIFNIKKSKKIEEDKKSPLIYNNAISTSASIAAGFGLDKLVQKGQIGFIEKFKEANKGNPKLNKYIEGLNILRPTLIFAFVYYGILPIISTYMADKIDKMKKTNDLRQQ